MYLWLCLLCENSDVLQCVSGGHCRETRLEISTRHLVFIVVINHVVIFAIDGIAIVIFFLMNCCKYMN